MEQSMKKKIKHICLVCDKVFDRAQRLKDHQSKTSCGTVCVRCNHKFPDRRGLAQHQKNVSIIDCDICGLKFCHRVDYSNHQRIVHNVNPFKCSTCNREFSSQQCLENHQQKAVLTDCDICDQKFCSLFDYKKHKIVEHCGGGVESPEDEEYTSSLKQLIWPTTWQEGEDGYKEVLQANKEQIQDYTIDRKGIYLTINKQLTSGFSYKDLEDCIWQALLLRKEVCRFNIAFGIILMNKTTKDFKYYYPSSNSMLFSRAKTISKASDVKNILKEIYDLDVGEHYRLLRPDSSWLVAGITNVFFKLMYLQIPLG